MTGPNDDPDAVRTVSDVIGYVVQTLLMLKPVGVAVEPIATMHDPDNEIEGDYVIRANFQVGAPTGREGFFCTVFQAALPMPPFLTMDDERLARNLIDLAEKAKTARDNPKGSGLVVTKDEVISMGDMDRRVRDAIRESGK